MLLHHVDTAAVAVAWTGPARARTPFCLSAPHDPQEPAMPGSIGEHLLQLRHGTVSRARGFYEHQMLDHLNDGMQAFIGRMEMVFIATADRSGEADCSLRAGPPGFVGVLDER